MPGKYGQASTGAPSVERLNPPAGGSTNPPAQAGQEKGTREYTHTHMGVHEDRGDLKKGEEDIRNLTDIGSSSNQMGCCLSKQKIKKWDYEKY